MNIPLTGNIRDISFVKILVFLNRSRMTGTLSLTTPSFTKKIHVRDGDAIFATSTKADDRLGEMLLKAGKITVEQYDRSVEQLKATKKRQGAILVELGYLTPKDLFWGVKYQVKEIIHSMFRLDEAGYAFQEGSLPTEEVITLKMSMANLIYEGVKQIESWTKIRSEMPDTDTVMRLTADPLNLFQGLELSQQDKKILTMINGKRTIKEVIENSWMSSFDALKILYVLWATGIIEQSTVLPAAGRETETRQQTVSLKEILQPHSEEEEDLLRRVEKLYPRLGEMTAHQLLEIDPKTDGEAAKKNYYRLAKEFHPDRYYSIADETIKAKLTAIFDAITRAYNAIKDGTVEAAAHSSSAPPETPVRDNAAKAEEQFRKGIDDFKTGKIQGAVEKFKRATILMPKNATYWSYLSLAFLKMPDRLMDAEEALLTATKLDPFNSDHYANLGLIYLKAGIKNRAKSNFEKALKIDAGNEKAKKGLALAGA